MRGKESAFVFPGFGAALVILQKMQAQGGFGMGRERLQLVPQKREGIALVKKSGCEL